ncbi:MAG: hypothetical protein ACJA0T_002740 [Colwellia sp.]|jgi:hypothetical protein
MENFLQLMPSMGQKVIVTSFTMNVRNGGLVACQNKGKPLFM